MRQRMEVSEDELDRPGPCLYPDCRTTAVLEAVRPGRVAVYCPKHAGYLRDHPDEDRRLQR